MSESDPAGRSRVSVPSQVLSASDALQRISDVVDQLLLLHERELLHRSVFATLLKSIDRPLPEPSREGIVFGGPACDVEQCLPESRRPTEIEVPSAIEDARLCCVAAGVLASPERIDIYQVGTLLCRLVCGRPIVSYLSSPGLISTIPNHVRAVIDGCLGYDETSRISSAAHLRRMLDVITEHSDADVSFEFAESIAVALRDTGANGATETNCDLHPVLLKLGQFELLEEIGRGGMGTVYRALDTSLNRIVAVKVLSTRLAVDSGFVQRFRAEASAAARLTHDRIVPIYFIGEDGGRHYYAMRLIDGESLADRLHRQQRLPLDQALQIISETLTGLAAAHRKGLVHRDIKPGNILIDREHGRAMLTDFGLAQSVVPDSDPAAPEEDSDAGLVMGTAEYMSPEQVRGEAVDQRSDLYSVGVVLYQLLSGAAPFDADTPTGHLMRHVSECPTPLEKRVPGLPEGLTAIVDRLLSKQPAQRYASVDNLLADLGPFLARADASGGDSERRAGRKIESSSAVAPPDTKKERAVRGPIAGVVVVLLVAASAAWNSMSSRAVSDTPMSHHRDSVTSLTFTSDGHFVVSAGGASSSLKRSGDTSLRLWDAATGVMQRQSPPLPVRPHCLVALPDDRRVVAFATARESASVVSLWDMHTGQPGTATFDEPFRFHFTAVAVGPESIIAVGRDGVSELEVDGHSISVRRLLQPTGAAPIQAFAFCGDRDDPLLILATTEDSHHVVRIVDWNSQTSVGRLSDFAGPVTAISATADGRIIAMRSTEPINASQPPKASADFVSIWDGRSRELLHRSGPLAAARPCLQLTSNGARLLTIGESTNGHPESAILLETASGVEICRYQTGGRFLTAVAISPHDRRAAIADADGQLVLCDLP